MDGNEVMATDHRDTCETHDLTSTRAHEARKRTKHHVTCDVCGKTFTDRSNMTRHKRTHNNNRRFECLVCAQKFYQKTHLDAHMLRHTLEKEFLCGLCDASFNRRMTLVTHLRTHTQEKGFNCPYCSERFNHKISLTTHIDNHFDVRRFLCHHCGRGFNKKANLKRHMIVHSRDTGGRGLNTDEDSQPMIADVSGVNDKDGHGLNNDEDGQSVAADYSNKYGRGLDVETKNQYMIIESGGTHGSGLITDDVKRPKTNSTSRIRACGLPYEGRKMLPMVLQSAGIGAVDFIGEYNEEVVQAGRIECNLNNEVPSAQPLTKAFQC